MMKKLISIILFPILLSTQALAQGDLHVKGKIKADSLANSGYLLIYADSSGTLDTLPAGVPGQVLISNGQGKPYWGNIASGSAIENFSVYATRTTITSTYPIFNQITGLSKTITLSDSVTILISSFGSLEAAAQVQYELQCHVQIFQNNVGISTAVQSLRDINNYIPVAITMGWSISTLVNVPPGTYTFEVRACKYGSSDDFYAGGNASSPVQNQGAMILQIFH